MFGGNVPEFSLVRFWFFIAVGVLSVVVLGLSGNIGWSLAIASSVLSLLAIGPILAITRFSPGNFAFVSWTAVELGWLFLILILWLSTGGVGASFASGPLCNGLAYDDALFVDVAAGYCSEIRAITAFAFLNFFMLTTLFIWILKMAVRVHNAGDKAIWLSSPADYSGPKSVETPPAMSNRNSVMQSAV